MSSSSPTFSRYFFILLVISPIIFMIILTITVVFPALRDPKSLMYGSSIGYPSLKRLINQPIKVKTASVEELSLSNNLSAPGETVALQSVDVFPLLSGTVQNVYVKEGQFVRKGERLLQIDQRQYIDNLSKARNNLTELNNQIRYQPQLHQQNLITLRANIKSAEQKVEADASNLKALPQKNAERLKELESNIEIAKKQVEIAKKKLEQINILQKEGGFSSSAFADIEQDYVERQQELISAQKQLAQERNSLQIELNNTLKTYAENQRLLTDAREALTQEQNQYREQTKNAQIKLENSKIEVSEAIRQLTQTVIYAPNNGLVSKVAIQKGEVAYPQKPVITLNQNIAFKAYIDQARINAVKVGDQAQVYFVAYPGKVFQGKVIQVNPTIETNVQSSSRVGINRQYTYSAWIKIDSLDIPPGLQGYVEFKQNQNRVIIPEDAVTHLSAGQGMVMLLEGGRGTIRNVKVGKRINNQREIISGLNLGEQVVLSPRALNPGDLLKQY